MKIQLKQIKIRDIINKYKDLKSKGVVGIVDMSQGTAQSKTPSGESVSGARHRP